MNKKQLIYMWCGIIAFAFMGVMVSVNFNSNETIPHVRIHVQTFGKDCDSLSLIGNSGAANT